MRNSVLRRVAVLAGALALGVSLTGAASAAPQGPSSDGLDATPAASTGSSGSSARTVPVCDRSVRPGHATCLSLVRTDVAARKGVQPLAETPNGYGPGDLQDAYDLPSDQAGAGETVAIVDAFDNPNAEADLAVYRQQYGLPPCTTEGGCFTKVNQRGEQGDYPPPDAGWAGEIALDIDMVSAVCPACHILLVEADDNSIANLGLAVNMAVELGADYVSNSYGAVEFAQETDFDQYYDHPGVAVTVSSGDSGYGVSFPAASQYVTAVGGTSLLPDSSTERGWTETVWGNGHSGTRGDGAGSGCSAYEAKPAWQTDPGCDMRTVADVSAVSDPATGVAVYNTYQAGGWLVYGGTSAAAPIIAATYALAGAPDAGSYPAQYPYDAAGALNDVTSGSNGSCDPAYLCTGVAGYDGPTGLGTPNGVTAFKATPHGILTGTVTDSGTGAPVAGATVELGELTATSGKDGTYRLRPQPGAYDMTVSAFGYQTKTVTGVVVQEGETTTRDVALDPAPKATLSGTVTDASGHGWPLYAKVSVPGTDLVTYTDPLTGTYQLTVGTGADRQVKVEPVYAGYQQASATVHVDGDTTQDFAVQIDQDACAAPGYAFAYDRPHQGFDDDTAPAGWTVDSESPHGFAFDNPGDLPNNTGGTGNLAVADAHHYGSWIDTTLTSPAFDLSAATAPVVEWKQDLRMWSTAESATVEVSVDGGPWQEVYRVDGDNDQFYGPDTEVVALPNAAGHADVRVRYHFFTNLAEFWWEVDDVYVGNRACAPVDGGLLVGTVTDRRTHEGVNHAVVMTVDRSARAKTVPTPDDPALGDGFYHLFVPGSGSQRFVATRPGYRKTRANVTIVADAVIRHDFVLRPRRR